MNARQAVLENESHILNADAIEEEWNNKSESDKTAIGITIDDRYLVINSPVLSALSPWNKPFEELSDLKKQRLVSFLTTQNAK